MKKKQWNALFLLWLFPPFILSGQQSTPHDWENEQVIGINKEAARAHSIPYASIRQASEDLRLNSPFLLDLNGTWKIPLGEAPRSASHGFFSTKL
jgi:beta-galactosidase